MMGQPYSPDNYQVYTGPQGPDPGYPPVYLQQRRLAGRPPMPPPPISLPRSQRAGDEEFWSDGCDDPVYLPQPRGPPRRRGFDPFADQGYPPPSSVTRDRGVAQDMIERMRGRQQGRMARSGFPGPAQSYAPQSNPQQQPVIYYDPATGATSQPQISSQSTSTPVQTAAPQMMGYPQGMMGMGGQQGYMYPGMMGQGMMGMPQGMMGMPQGMMGMPQGMMGMPQGMMGMPQGMGYMMPMMAPQQQQPIVVPGQLYTAAGGVQQLG